MSDIAAFGIGIIILIALCYFVIRIEISKLETKIDDVYMFLRIMRREQQEKSKEETE